MSAWLKSDSCVVTRQGLRGGVQTPRSVITTIFAKVRARTFVLAVETFVHKLRAFPARQ